MPNLFKLNLSYTSPFVETLYTTSLQKSWQFLTTLPLVRGSEVFFTNKIGLLDQEFNLSLNTVLILNQTTCPNTLESLINQLLPDLPSYVNRVIQRTSAAENTTEKSSIILAKKAEFEPLSIDAGIANSEQLQQVFITTLERQYQQNRMVQVQRYHWLLFRQTENGWQLIKMFSKSSPHPASKRLLEPSDTSKSAIAEAIRLWLRDCQRRKIN